MLLDFYAMLWDTGPITPPSPSVAITLEGTAFVELLATGTACAELLATGTACVELLATGDVKLTEVIQ